MLNRSVLVSSWKIKQWGRTLVTLLFLALFLPISSTPSAAQDDFGFYDTSEDGDGEENDPSEDFDDDYDDAGVDDSPNSNSRQAINPDYRSEDISGDYYEDGILSDEDLIADPPPMGDEEDTIQFEDEDLIVDQDYEGFDEAQDFVEGGELPPDEEIGDDYQDAFIGDSDVFDDQFPEEIPDEFEAQAGNLNDPDDYLDGGIEPFEYEDDKYTENDSFIIIPEDEFDESVVQFEDDDVLRRRDGNFAGYESPLPPIAARTYALKLDRKSRSGNVYLFQDMEEAIPKEGRILLVRQGNENARAFRILKRYPGRQRIAAATIRKYDFGDLKKGFTYTGIEKLGDIARPAPPMEIPPEIEEDVREIEDEMGFVDRRDFEDEGEIEADPGDPSLDDDFIDFGEESEDEPLSPISENDDFADGTLEFEDFDSFASDPFEFEDEEIAGQEEEDAYAEDEKYSEEYYGDYADREGVDEDLDEKDLDDLNREGPDEDDYRDYVVGTKDGESIPDDETEDEYQDFVEWDPEAKVDEPVFEEEPEFETVGNPIQNPGLINADVLEEVALKRSSGPENLILLERSLLEPDKNWLTGTFGVLQGRSFAGGLTYFSGGGVRFGRIFKRDMFSRFWNREDSLAWEASLLAFKVLFYEQPNDSFTVVPLVGTVRYNVKLSDFVTLYAYAGLLRNFVVSSFNASDTAIFQLNSIGIAGGGGALITIGPKWNIRVNLGIDAAAVGLVVEF